jgi:hypothetical protein
MFQKSKEIKLKEGLQFDPSEMETLALPQKESVEKALRWEGQGFDIRVHIVEPKSGQLLKYQPYKRVCSLAHGVYYLRKDESGVERRYTEQGHPMDVPAQAKPKEDRKSA